MIILGNMADYVKEGKIKPLKDRAKYVVALDEWGEVLGNVSMKESPVRTTKQKRLTAPETVSVMPEHN